MSQPRAGPGRLNQISFISPPSWTTAQAAKLKSTQKCQYLVHCSWSGELHSNPNPPRIVKKRWKDVFLWSCIHCFKERERERGWIVIIYSGLREMWRVWPFPSFIQFAFDITLYHLPLGVALFETACGSSNILCVSVPRRWCGHKLWQLFYHEATHLVRFVGKGSVF